MDKYKFGEFIYQKRKSLGLTQDELGRKLGVTNKAVSKWETGETFPEIVILTPLASLLNISVDELLTQKENQPQQQKNMRINRCLCIAIAILLIIEAMTVWLFLVKPRNEIHPQVAVDVLNYQQWITIVPSDAFALDDQKLNITSTYFVNKAYRVKEVITLQLRFTIHFYYYKIDGTTGVITYYNRSCTVTIANNEVIYRTVSVLPKQPLSDYRGLKTFEVLYEVTAAEGLLQKE